MSHDVGQRPVPAPRFGFFLMQTQVTAADEETLVRLTVEDLSSGERRVFKSIRELSHFLRQLLEPGGDRQWAPPSDAEG